MMLLLMSNDRKRHQSPFILVVLDLEKMKTPPRGSMSSQIMTPPRKVDNETMNEITQAREIHTDFVAFVAKPDGPLHDTNAAQTVTTVFDAIASQSDDPERHDNGKMTAGNTEMGLHSHVVADVDKAKSPLREGVSSQTDGSPAKVDNSTMMESASDRQMHTNIICDVERPVTPPRGMMSSQTMTPPGCVDNEITPLTERHEDSGLIFKRARTHISRPHLLHIVLVDLQPCEVEPQARSEIPF